MPRTDSEISAQSCIVSSIALAVHCINQNHNLTSPVETFQREFEKVITKSLRLRFVREKEREGVESFLENLKAALRHYQ